MDLVVINLDPFIEEDHRCFVLGGYFMAALLAAASYSRIVFSIYLAVRVRRLRVPGGSKFHLGPPIPKIYRPVGLTAAYGDRDLKSPVSQST